MKYLQCGLGSLPSSAIVPWESSSLAPYSDAQNSTFLLHQPQDGWYSGEGTLPSYVESLFCFCQKLEWAIILTHRAPIIILHMTQEFWLPNHHYYVFAPLKIITSKEDVIFQDIMRVFESSYPWPELLIEHPVLEGTGNTGKPLAHLVMQLDEQLEESALWVIQ